MMIHRSVRHGLIVFSLTFGSLKLFQILIHRTNFVFPFQTFTSLVLLVLPFILVRKSEAPSSKSPLVFSPMIYGIITAILLCLPVFTGYAVARIGWNLLLNLKPLHFHFTSGIVFIALVQLLIVSLPEEVFFRGYLFHCFVSRDRIPKSLKEHLFNRGVLLSAVLFATAHFILSPNPLRLATFFPGVLFGFLRSKTGSLSAPVTAHAMANILIYVLEGKV